MFRTPPTSRKGKLRGAVEGPVRDEHKKYESEMSSHIKQEAVASDKQSRSAHKRTGSHCSSLSRRRNIELEAARTKALLQIEATRAQAEATAKIKAIQADLVDKQLAADIEELERERRSRSSRSVADSRTMSMVSRVEEWIDESALSQQRQPTPDPEVQQSSFSDNGGKGKKKTDIEKLADVLQKTMFASSTPKDREDKLLTRLATSKDLPFFQGDPLEWLQFKQAFYESSKLCDYSDTENLWRLRKCLRGDAKDAVSSLLIGGTSPEQIIETLELQFGQPDTIINKLVTQLKKLQPLPSAYHHDIVSFAIKVKNYVTATKAIKEIDYLRSPEMAAIIISKFPSTLVCKWTEYAFEHQQSDLPRLEKLSDFLYKEANKTAVSGVSHIHYQTTDKRKPDERKNTHAVLVSATNSEAGEIPKCRFCRVGRHALPNCPRFKRALRRDRWRFARTQRLCFKCLSCRHREPETCQGDNCDVNDCGQPHHRLLHWVAPKNKNEESYASDKPSGNSDEIVTQTNAERCCKVLLKIVPLTIHGPKGSKHLHALLDGGATVTLLSADVADELGLHSEKRTMRARGAWDVELVCQMELIDFEISNNNGEKYLLKGRKIKELNLPTQHLSDIDFSRYYGQIPEDFELCDCGVQPKLLIGQDHHELIATEKCIRGKQRAPYLTKTALGWCVHGNNAVSDSTCMLADRFSEPALNFNVCQKQRGSLVPICHLISVEDIKSLSQPSPYQYVEDHDAKLYDEVRQSFTLESIGVCLKPRQSPEDIRAVAILDDTSQLIEGQWTVGLPWKHDDVVLPDSYPQAFNRLRTVEKKMLGNKDYASRYRERVQHLFTNNFARELRGDDDRYKDRIWYLPHFGVDNPNKAKLRLVYDAAAKSKGVCINDFLLQGPDLLQSLLGIMLRFREHPVGVIGDIKDMFLRIKIRKEDMNAFRFLWREQTSEPVKKYVMTSLIFGANCSPFIAQYVNQIKNTERFQKAFPEAVQAIRKNQYMDDYIDSLPDSLTAVKMVNDILFINQQGGFLMRNWLSNSVDVLRGTPKETLNEKAVRFNIENQSERTLGLLWYPATDKLGFDLSFKRIPKEVFDKERKPTKREMLRIIMSIYDIHGFLGPFTIQGKIIMQEAWKSEIKWDQAITDELFLSFRGWLEQLQLLNCILIPRWYFHTKDEQMDLCNTASKHTRADVTSGKDLSVLELHVFCDASPCAYAAVAYWRKQNSDGSVQVSFIASKSRVASVKGVSIARLELQGGLLGSRLAETIKTEHRLKPNKTFYWTDSTTVLHWIRNENKKYKPFIENRLGEICNTSTISEWYYVPSKCNPADLASKKHELILSSDSLWFTGPAFLREERDRWPQDPVKKEGISDDVLEKIQAISSEDGETNSLPVPDYRRFSNWLRLLRSSAAVLLFIEKCRKKKVEINSELLKKAEVLLLRNVQMQSFSEEIHLLKQNKPLKRDSRLRELTPYLDNEGLLRVGGRIGAAKGVEECVKNPYILDGRNHMSRLIVKDYHVRAQHSYNELVVNELRQKYWLLNLRPTVRTVASQCLICRIRKAVPIPPRLGDLPEERLTHHERPFSVCGVDLFGPIEVTVGRQRPKRYGVLFTCLTVRAVHIEIVASLTTDSLIMALRRMAARRGWPHTILSDNGTNLRGADVELRKTFQEVDQQELELEALNRNVTWRFIPPASPHMGGAWERLIRSVKTSLKIVLKERAPREEVLSTFLAEIENIINSRPLTHVSVDPKGDEALTPNHFLLGSSSNVPLPGVFSDGDLCLGKQWRMAQRLTDLYWNRWVREVLPELIPRRKWNQEGLQLKVGDLVVVADPSSPRNTWQKGIINKVYPGPDGRVRVVDIRTRAGVIKRPAARVASLTRRFECPDDH